MIAAYAFFASHGKYEFEPIAWDQAFDKPGEGFYASLAEGFLRGQTSMAHEPDPRLVALKTPYDYEARHKAEVSYLWDASYYRGRYYLYFSPVPALLLHIPYRAFTGAYPHDITAGLFFASWAFLMIAACATRALRLLARRPLLPLWLWLSMLGVGNLIPVVIIFCRTYEIAILCGAAMSSTFAFALLRFLESPTNARLVHAAVWLALAIATRPNLGVLLPVLFAAIYIKRREDLFKAVALAMIPLAVAAGSLAAYNYARFGSVSETGVKYQLTYMDMKDWRVCSLCTGREAVRLVNTAGIYTGAPLTFFGDFPFVRLTMQNLDPTISFSQYTDLVGGLGVLIPLTILGSVLAAILACRKEPNDDGTRGGLLIAAGGWLALLGLSTCWYASARYELDFMLLVAAGAVICIEAGLPMFAQSTRSLLVARVALAAMACYSIVTAVFLGFTGAHDAFLYRNPELYERLGDLFR